MPDIQDITVHILDDGQRAQLHIPSGYKTESLTPELLSAIATNAKVVMLPEVSQRLAEVAHDYLAQPRELIVDIAVATQPEHGQDGTWKWEPGLEGAGTLSGRTLPAENTKAPLIYERPELITVVVGAKVAMITSPSMGTDGRSVTGDVLPAKRGRAAPIRAGEGLEVRSDGSVVAKINGVLHTVSGVASVSSVLEIQENVDLATGNIQFHGDVYVRGSVCDGYKLHASGNVTVLGSVEGAEIVCGGELACPRGVASARRARIAVGSLASFGFLRNTQAIIRGDLHCRGEMEHCEITVSGACECELGRVIGGTLVLSSKSLIGTLGSPNWIPTRVCVGGLPIVAAQLGRLNIDYSKLQKVIFAKSEALQQLQAAAGTLNATMREKLTELQYEVSELSRDAAGIDAERTKLQAATQLSRKCELQVTQMIYPKVRIQHGEGAFEFNKELKGPVRFLIDDKGEILVRVSTGNPVSIMKYSHAVKAVMTLGEGSEPTKKCA